MTGLNDIEKAAAAYRLQRDLLTDAVAKMEEEVKHVRAGHMEEIRPLIDQVKEAHKGLHDLVEGAPDLFAKPKTKTFSAIKVGFQKQPGKLVIADAKKTVLLIRRHLKTRAKDLLKISVSPVKAAIAKLSAEDLKKIGCKVDAVDDAVVVSPVKSDAEKVIDALLNSTEAEE